MPAKKKQASLKKTKSTTTYQRGGAKPSNPMLKKINTAALAAAGLPHNKKNKPGNPVLKRVNKAASAANKAGKSVYQKGGAKKAVKAAAKGAKRRTVIDSKIKSKRPATLDNSGPKILRAQRGMGVGEEFINSMQVPRMRPNPVGPTPNDARTDRFINAMDNVDRGLNRVLPGREGRQRNRAIKRGARQDARLNRSLDRINRDRGPRNINPEGLPPLGPANTRGVPNRIPRIPRESMNPGDAGMINPRPVRVRSTQTGPSALQQGFKAYDEYINQRQEGGISHMFRNAAKGAMGLDTMGKGGVIKGSALRNNSRRKARKNR